MGYKNLILLIGTNPIPNYVVAQVLKEEIKKVYLVYSEHTKEQIGTKKYADSLAGIITRDKNITCHKIALSEINSAAAIHTDLEHHLPAELSNIHLNYTGGTKTMAVHVYLFLEKRYADKFTASYLDARTFSLVYDDISIDPIIDLRNRVSITLPDIFKLHGYGLCNSQTDLPESLRAYSNRIIEGLIKNPSQDIPINIAEIYPNDGAVNSEEIKGGLWLEKVIFLKAKEWIAIQRNASLTVFRNVSAKREDGRDCEVDIVVLNGYQLILISVSKTKDQSKLKAKAFEVYHRAKQLGGEEASAILVTAWKRGEKENGRALTKIQLLEWDVSQFLGTASGNLLVVAQEDWLNIGGVITKGIND